MTSSVRTRTSSTLSSDIINMRLIRVRTKRRNDPPKVKGQGYAFKLTIKIKCSRERNFTGWKRKRFKTQSQEEDPPSQTESNRRYRSHLRAELSGNFRNLHEPSRTSRIFKPFRNLQGLQALQKPSGSSGTFRTFRNLQDL